MISRFENAELLLFNAILRNWKHVKAFCLCFVISLRYQEVHQWEQLVIHKEVMFVDTMTRIYDIKSYFLIVPLFSTNEF